MWGGKRTKRIIQELLGSEICLGIQAVGSVARRETVALGMVESINSLLCFVNFRFVLLSEASWVVDRSGSPIWEWGDQGVCVGGLPTRLPELGSWGRERKGSPLVPKCVAGEGCRMKL